MLEVFQHPFINTFGNSYKIIFLFLLYGQDFKERNKI
jgi:hypothetical protein